MFHPDPPPRRESWGLYADQWTSINTAKRGEIEGIFFGCDKKIHPKFAGIGEVWSKFISYNYYRFMMMMMMMMVMVMVMLVMMMMMMMMMFFCIHTDKTGEWQWDIWQRLMLAQRSKVCCCSLVLVDCGHHGNLRKGSEQREWGTWNKTHGNLRVPPPVPPLRWPQVEPRGQEVRDFFLTVVGLKICFGLKGEHT